VGQQSAYFKNEGGSAVDDQGWLKTGDLATIAPDGRIQLTDRSKDVIKSGGEWISSVELENLAMGHPAVLQAAVIAVPHPRWQERPLLVVVRKPGPRWTPMRCWPSCAARSSTGGCPTTWPLSTACR
jgi:fatty-acyl-CoA synthase